MLDGRNGAIDEPLLEVWQRALPLRLDYGRVQCEKGEHRKVCRPENRVECEWVVDLEQEEVDPVPGLDVPRVVVDGVEGASGDARADERGAEDADRLAQQKAELGRRGIDEGGAGVRRA